MIPLKEAHSDAAPAGSAKEFRSPMVRRTLNRPRREAIDERFPEDAVLHDGRAEYRSPTEFKRFCDALRAQLSEVRVTPLETISEGDMVCMRWSSTAKQSSTGKHLEVTGISLLRFKDGRLVEAWQNWGQHGPPPANRRRRPKSFFQAAG